ncbi:MAG: hypothetical protein M3220_16535 [Chloroflexota bacterium]|nr:hypothetical protein [Chloroflexota bacterium]
MQAVVVKRRRPTRRTALYASGVMGLIAVVAFIAFGLLARVSSPTTIPAQRQAPLARMAGQAESYTTQLDALRQQGQQAAQSQRALTSTTNANEYAHYTEHYGKSTVSTSPSAYQRYQAAKVRQLEQADNVLLAGSVAATMGRMARDSYLARKHSQIEQVQVGAVPAGRVSQPTVSISNPYQAIKVWQLEQAEGNTSTLAKRASHTRQAGSTAAERYQSVKAHQIEN